MAPSAPFLTLSLILLPLLLSSFSHALTCTSQKFTSNDRFDRCNDLPQLGSYLHWSLDSSKSTLKIAFMAPPAKSDGWISWAINPTGTGMAGSQALVAFRAPDGQMTVKKFNLSSYTSIVPTSELSFDVKDERAEYSDGLMKIFATVTLPVKGATTVNQVWQVGPSVSDEFPAKHDFQPANLNSKGTLDLLSGQSTGGTGVDSRTKNRNIHGVLNVVSWGIMFPFGVIIARYLRTFESLNPTWFYLHATCQFSGYVIGVAGWATGLKLGKESKGITYSTHRALGISLFCLATLQICALFVRPNNDHKYRFYWNIYHHGAGYAILILSVLNVFKGFDILKPEDKWRTAYIGVIVGLGVIAVLLQAITWVLVIKKKKSNNSTKPAQ